MSISAFAGGSVEEMSETLRKSAESVGQTGKTITELVIALFMPVGFLIGGAVIGFFRGKKKADASHGDKNPVIEISIWSAVGAVGGALAYGLIGTLAEVANFPFFTIISKFWGG